MSDNPLPVYKPPDDNDESPHMEKLIDWLLKTLNSFIDGNPDLSFSTALFAFGNCLCTIATSQNMPPHDFMKFMASFGSKYLEHYDYFQGIQKQRKKEGVERNREDAK